MDTVDGYTDRMAKLTGAVFNFFLQTHRKSVPSFGWDPKLPTYEIFRRTKLHNEQMHAEYGLTAGLDSDPY
jgi:hypothetical protein